MANLEDGAENNYLDGFPDQPMAESEPSSSGTPSVTSSDETDEDQPRERFYSSGVKYVRHNKSELDLAKSLDTLEAEDLSIHLFNAHAWKRRVRQSRNPPKGEKGTDTWIPPRLWTAWPLPSEDVPRSSERFMQYCEVINTEDELIKPKPKSREKPSGPLEECLLGEVLKQAKDQFRLKYSEVDDDLGSEQPPAKRRKVGTVDPNHIPQQQAQDTDDSSEPQAEESQHADSNDSSEEAPETNHRTHNPAELSVEKEPEEAESFEPTIMLDEEAARKIAQPAIRHVFSRFDQLLMILHHSRRHTHRPRRWQAAERLDHSDRSGNRDDAAQTREPIARDPRDWSEVLAAAALAGWDKDVLQRAAARCSGLFGETMSFTTLHETEEINQPDEASEESEQESEQQSQRGEDATEETSDDDSAASSSAPRITIDPKLLVCTVPSCPRYMSNFKATWRFQHHMVRFHGYKGNVWDKDAEDKASLEEAWKDEMIGGVHQDGFLKPILLRSNWVNTTGKKKESHTTSPLTLQR